MVRQVQVTKYANGYKVAETLFNYTLKPCSTTYSVDIL